MASQGQEQKPETPSPPSALSKWSPLLIIFFMAFYFGSLFLYFWGIGPERYSTVEAIRPILVFTLIVAMLGFGGVLILSSVFGKEKDFKERFTKAREIFLVFSGIFGTIIGFYFGTAEGDGGTPPSLTTPAYAAAQVTVQIEGGRAPFIALLTRDGQADGQVIQGEGRALSFAIAGGCPADASVKVVDGEGRRDEAEVTCPEEGDAAGNAVAPANESGSVDNTAG